MPVSCANGVEIFYETAGAGPPLIMLHALPFDHNLWLYQVARFSADFTTIAMDLRGWGRSGKPVEPFSLRDIGNDVLGVLDDAGVAGKVILLDCSIGSKLALMLACDHPDRVGAVVLVGGNSDHQDFGRRITGYRAHGAAGTLKQFSRSGARARREQHRSSLSRARRSDQTGRLEGCLMTTLIVNGQFDNALKGGDGRLPS